MRYFDTSKSIESDIVSEMSKAEIIYIQNVADYFYEVEQNDSFDLAADFPNIAPPFPRFWMEFTMPHNIRVGNDVLVNQLHGFRFGFLFVSGEVAEQLDEEFILRWVTRISIFLGYKDEIYQPAEFLIGIDQQGRVASRPDGVQAIKTHPENADKITILFPALLSISFMHCKNVSVISHEPKIGNRKKRGRNAPEVRYHTLQIEPMKKLLNREGNAEETGIKHALHICRGHFKDFTKGKGLFGRYKNVFWWDSQVRGSGENGVTIKDYNIIK